MHNKKNIFKKAFSLVEVSVIMIFIGIIVTYELIILNGKINDYSGLYYNTYNTLSLLTYNVYADPECANVEPTSSGDNYSKCYPDGEKRTFPMTGDELCRRFGEFLNVGKDNFCTPVEGDDENMIQSKESVAQDASNIGEKTLRFVTSNGSRFHIDETLYKYRIDNSKFKYPDGSNATIEYFLVYVDINGKKGPNRVSMESGDRYLPDIVPFAVTRRGEVVPMGYPVYSTKYMTAKISYPESHVQTSHNNDDGTTSSSLEEESKQSEAVSYYEAIHRAYGNKPVSCKTADIEKSIFFDNKYTYQLCGTLNKNHINQSESSDNIAIKFLYDNTVKLPETPEIDADSANGKDCCMSNNLSGECNTEGFECKVIVESNADTRVNFSF